MMHVRSILIGLSSGAVAGFVIGGIGGRIAMRIIADSIGRSPALTFDTVTVLLIGTIFGTAGGLIFFAVKSYLSQSTFMQGIGLTAIVFAIVSLPFFLRPPGSGSELALNPTLGRALFSILFISYGFAVPVLARIMDGRLPAQARYRTRMTIATLMLGGPGLLGIGIMVSLLFGE